MSIILPLINRYMWVKMSSGKTTLARNTPQKVKAVDLRKYMDTGKKIKILALGNTK